MGSARDVFERGPQASRGTGTVVLHGFWLPGPTREKVHFEAAVKTDPGLCKLAGWIGKSSDGQEERHHRGFLDTLDQNSLGMTVLLADIQRRFATVTEVW